MMSHSPMASAPTGNGKPVLFFKSKLRTALLCLFFLLSFSSFKFIPGLNIIFLTWIGTVFTFLLTAYPITVSSNNFRISKFELYSLFLLLYVPLISAYMANSEFGQPWINGIGTTAQNVMIGDVMILFYLYKRKFFSLADIERGLLWLAWINLFSNLLIQNALDANQFDEVAGFVGGMEGQKKFILQGDFILIGFFYYAFKGYWEKNTRSSFLALLFFVLMALGGGRSALISILASYLFFMTRWETPGKVTRVFLKILALGVLLLVSMFLFLPDKLTEMGGKFGDAFTVVLEQKEVEDISANARNSESMIAFPYIEKHWLLGNGLISPSWNDGYKSLLGYFHPSDIGIIGVLYMYGLVGMLLFLFQYYFAIRYSRRLPKDGGRHGRLVNALKGYLLFVAFNSITTGRFAVFVEQGLLVIAILYCAAQTERMGEEERFMKDRK